MRVIAVISALGAGLLATGWALAASTPAWWTENQPAGTAKSVDDQNLIATRLENAFITEATRARPTDPAHPGRSEPWAVLIRESDMNAWLSVKAPRWLASPSGAVALPGNHRAWEASLAEARVKCRAGSLTLGVRLHTERTDRIVWLACTPSIRQGDLWLAAASLHIGKLQAPAGWVLESKPAASGRGGGGGGDVLKAVLGTGPLVSPPTLRLHDGRRVRLLDVRVEDAAIVLTCATEAAGS